MRHYAYTGFISSGRILKLCYKRALKKDAKKAKKIYPHEAIEIYNQLKRGGWGYSAEAKGWTKSKDDSHY